MGINSMPVEAVGVLANALNTTPAYLMGWEEPTNITPVESMYTYTVIGTIRAGDDGEAIEETLGEDISIPTSLLRKAATGYFVLQVKGDSMYPKFFDGDRVLVERTDSVDSGSIAVVLYNQSEATLKNVEYVSGKDWLDLIPLNTNYPPLRIEGESLNCCKVLGKVIYLYRYI